MDNRRRQMLADMGIEVWVSRSARPDDPIPTPDNPAIARTPAFAAARTPEPAHYRTPAVNGPSSTVAEKPFSVMAWSLPGVLLLSSLDLEPLQRRLILDLLAAASGLYGARPETAEFDGSKLASTGMDIDAGRALNAFLTRRLEQARPELVLVQDSFGSSIHPLLKPHAHIRIVDLPALDELAWSAQFKRNFWIQLQERKD